MARKAQDMTAGDQHAMVDAVLASAQQIWQAGLGAFVKAQQEGGAWFDKLVQEGAELHQLTHHLTGDQPVGVAGKMSRLAEQVGKQASGSWDKIEKVFEDRVARSLRSLGVPSRDELGELRREVADLRAMIDAVAKQAVAKQAVAKQAVAESVAAKPAAAKSSAAEPTAAKPAARAPAKARAKAAAAPAAAAPAPKRQPKAGARHP